MICGFDHLFVILEYQDDDYVDYYDAFLTAHHIWPLIFSSTVLWSKICESLTRIFCAGVSWLPNGFNSMGIAKPLKTGHEDIVHIHEEIGILFNQALPY